MGFSEGPMEGTVDGELVGVAEGGAEGNAEGSELGIDEGSTEGSAEGNSEGSGLGITEGNTVGKELGSGEGAEEGKGEGPRAMIATLTEDTSTITSIPALAERAALNPSSAMARSTPEATEELVSAVTTTSKETVSSKDKSLRRLRLARR